MSANAQVRNHVVRRRSNRSNDLNAMVTIQVTQHDIDHGTRMLRPCYMSKSCPIFSAMRRQIISERITKVCGITSTHAVIVINSEIINVPLSHDAQQFIAHFDQSGRKAVMPFQFEFDVTQ